MANADSTPKKCHISVCTHNARPRYLKCRQCYVYWKKLTAKHECKAEGCSEPGWRTGYCEPHHQMWLVHGDPNGGSTRMGEPLAFLKNTVANPPDHCVIWPYAKGESGHGQIWIDGKYIVASRYSLMLYAGEPADPSLHACHKPGIGCQSSCINPLHLRWDTQANNVGIDRMIDGTATFGEKNGNAKISNETVLEIYKDPNPDRQAIADKYGIRKQDVNRIKGGQRWKHVTGHVHVPRKRLKKPKNPA